MNDDYFLYIMSFLLFAGVTSVLLIQFVFKKWKCNKGTCEKVLGGDYSSLRQCKESAECNSPSTVNLNTDPTPIPRTSSENLNTDPTPIPFQNTEYGYDCINKQCVGRQGGLHPRAIDCQYNCETIPDYSYGYPYSYVLYPYGTNYGYGRRWSRRRSRSPRRRSRSPRRRSRFPRRGSRSPRGWWKGNFRG